MQDQKYLVETTMWVCVYAYIHTCMFLKFRCMSRLWVFLVILVDEEEFTLQ